MEALPSLLSEVFVKKGPSFISLPAPFSSLRLRHVPSRVRPHNSGGLRTSHAGIRTITHIQSLLDKVRAGDEAARAELISYPMQRLRRLARWMFHRQPQLMAAEETDDVLQKALIRLHQALAETKPENVRAYFNLASRQIRWVLQDLARKPATAKAVQYAGDLASTGRREKLLAPLDPD